MGWMTNEDGLDKCAANYVPLTPLSHLKRAAHVFADVTAVIYGAHRVSYAQYHARCSQLASALVAAGVEPGQVVATILPNIPAQAEAHFGVPACGAVLNTINTRLDVDTVGYILDHGEARVLLVDTQFVDLAEAACATLDGPPPLLIEVPDPAAGFPATGRHTTYDDFIATGDPAFNWIMPQDEWESLALNYTSGTTGRPKGVLGTLRGLTARLRWQWDALPWAAGEVQLRRTPLVFVDAVAEILGAALCGVPLWAPAPAAAAGAASRAGGASP